MLVEDILKAKGRRVITVRPDTLLTTATKRMQLDQIGALVVSDDGAHFLGLVSERDIAQGFARYGPELTDKKVSDLMQRNVPTCALDDKLSRVMADMTRHRARHIPVIEEGRLAGIVSIGDVIKNLLDELELERSVLRDALLARH